MNAAPEREAGFTLVEVLVVLALLALLTGALFGGIRFGIHVWEKVSLRSAEADQTLLVGDFLRRTIGAAYPAFVRDDPTHGHVDFVGSQLSMSFVGPTPVSRGVGGRSRYVLSLEQAEGGLALTVATRPELAASGAASEAKEVLLARLKGGAFSYFGRVRADPPQWRNEWASDAGPPELVRIRVSYPAGEGRVWPDLLVAPRIAADVSCTYDPLTRRCGGR